MRKEKNIALTGIITIIVIGILAMFFIFKISGVISELERETQNLQSELNNEKNNLKNTNHQLTQTQNDINQVTKNLEKTNSYLEKLRSGSRYTLHDPLYSEIHNFLSSDQTNKKPYDDDTFNCANYAQEVNNNAENQSIRCAFVAVNLSEESHALVGFNTTDRGLVYFEPQNDYEVKLQTGKDYWADCVVPPYGYYYERDAGWIIQDFTIYW